MKGTQQHKTHEFDIPYEKEGIELWKKHVANYDNAIFLAIPQNIRMKWMKHPAFADLNVFSCGYFENAHGHKWTRSDLNEGVLIYCVEGKGFYTYDNKTYAVNAGDILYCPPLTQHSYHTENTSAWTIYWMHVCGTKLPFLTAQIGLAPENPIRSIGIRSELITLFRDLLHRFDPTSNEKTRLLSNSQAQLILATICAQPDLPQQITRYTKLTTQLIHVMHEHMATPLTIDDLAKFADISPSYVHRIFKQVTGFSPIDYYNRLRVRTACSMLTVSNQPVHKIASRLGFQDTYYFSRLFKRISGLSPTQYRAMLVPAEQNHLGDSYTRSSGISSGME